MDLREKIGLQAAVTVLLMNMAGMTSPRWLLGTLAAIWGFGLVLTCIEWYYTTYNTGEK